MIVEFGIIRRRFDESEVLVWDIDGVERFVIEFKGLLEGIDTLSVRVSKIRSNLRFLVSMA